MLVVIGVNARGDKHFLAVEDGVRESTQSWPEVVLGMQQRGFTRPAKLAVGDGRWASGRRCRRSIRRPAASGAGCTRPATSSTVSPSPGSRRRSRDCTRSGWPTPAPRSRAPSTTGSNLTRRSTRRPPRAWRATPTTMVSRAPRARLFTTPALVPRQSGRGHGQRGDSPTQGVSVRATRNPTKWTR